MLDSVCENSQSKRLNLSHRILSRGSVHQRPGDLHDLGYPAAISFLLRLNCESESHLRIPFVQTRPLPYVGGVNPSVPVVICPRSASAAIMPSTLEMLRE